MFLQITYEKSFLVWVYIAFFYKNSKQGTYIIFSY